MAKRKIEKTLMTKLLKDSYMSYATSTITERNFPYIDGYKPVQKLILYTMYELGLDRKATKSARIVGDTMGKYHPHGDAAIYEAMCQMGDNVESRNAPEIKATGCFGKSWSTSALPKAHQRYTEARLSNFASKYLFNGLREGAVDYVPNYDNTLKYPVLLPVCYPNIIVNTSSGVACGIKTYIPSYTLTNACKATIGLLDGTIKDMTKLSKVLDAPDFPTGGVINITEEQKMELLKTGNTKGIYLTGRYRYENNEMRIYELPYNTTCEKVFEQVEDCIKERKIPGITRVVNSTGKTGLSITIYIQKGFSAEEVFRYLCTFTDVQTRIAFQTRFIHIDTETRRVRDKEVGIYSLLNDYWIPWRIGVIRKMYEQKLVKLQERHHKMLAWKCVGDRIKEYVEILMNNNRTEAKEIHKKEFALSDIQEEYLLGHNVDALTLDGVLRNIAKIATIEEEIKDIKIFLDGDRLIKKQMIQELKGVIKEAGTPRKTTSEGIATLIHLSREEATAISDEEVWVGVTEKCRLKKAVTEKDAENFDTKLDAGDKMWMTYQMNNTDKLMVMTTGGFIYKLPVNSLDASARTNFKDNAWRFINKDKADVHVEFDRRSEIFFIAPLGKAKTGFNLVYKQGKIKKIRSDAYSSSRSVFKNAFPEYDMEGFIVNYDELFLVTSRGRGLVVDINDMYVYDKATKSNTLRRLPKLKEDEYISNVYSAEAVRRLVGDEVFGYYCKKYFVRIRGTFDVKVALEKLDSLDGQEDESADSAVV